MSMAFRTHKLRDDLSRRLSDIAVRMIRSGDQGSDHRILVTPEMIDDIRAAACVVGMAETLESGKVETK
jgi:predicted transcriptional regulator